MVNRQRTTRLSLRLLPVAFAGLMSCQTTAVDSTPLILSQTPPAVQSAYLAVHQGSVIQKIIRQTRGGQDYYTFTYLDSDKKPHDVELNEGGDQVDQH